MELTMHWIPAKMAARILGVTRQRVYALASEGKLESVKTDGCRLVSLSSVDKRLKKLTEEGG